MAIAIGYYRVWFKEDDSNTEAQWFKMTLRKGSVRPSIHSINREEALWWIKSRKMKDVTPGNPAARYLNRMVNRSRRHSRSCLFILGIIS